MTDDRERSAIRSLDLGAASRAPGDRIFHLHFRGRISTELIAGHVTRADEQEIRLPFRLIWRAPLPI